MIAGSNTLELFTEIEPALLGRNSPEPYTQNQPHLISTRPPNPLHQNSTHDTEGLVPSSRRHLPMLKERNRCTDKLDIARVGAGRRIRHFVGELAEIGLPEGFDLLKTDECGAFTQLRFR